MNCFQFCGPGRPLCWHTIASQFSGGVRGGAGGLPGREACRRRRAELRQSRSSWSSSRFERKNGLHATRVVANPKLVASSLPPFEHTDFEKKPSHLSPAKNQMAKPSKSAKGAPDRPRHTFISCRHQSIQTRFPTMYLTPAVKSGRGPFSLKLGTFLPQYDLSRRIAPRAPRYTRDT